MSTTNHKAWYKEWFDTPYYHMLYKHRDDHEAQLLIKNLLQKTPVQKDWHFLDLACGRGRHAKFLNQQGYRVTGLDLAPQNVSYAQLYASDSLQFKQADMREPYGDEEFDCILNLFTSFGYFASKEESARACRQMKKALKQGGYLWLDFMNIHKVALGLVPNEYKVVGNIEFCLERKLEAGQVVKEITFTDGGEDYRFQERVQLLTLQDFEQFFKEAQLNIESVYGNYELEPYAKEASDRLILKATA